MKPRPVQWVERYFTVDVEAKTIVVASASPSANASGAACAHTKVHHKGSSARYVKTTCCACNESWSVERNPVTKNPETCQHFRTDHRGSNHRVRKTYCLDCGTYIDSVAQELAKSLSEETSSVSAEEQALLDRVGEHDTISKAQIVRAAEVMLAESRQLEDGDYTLISIGNLFIDCADRVIAERSAAQKTAMMYMPRRKT